jgi:2-C-methyl-D-erythritol 4-phosphate cytidylyltransferase
MAWSLAAFAKVPAVDEIVVTAPSGQVRTVEMALGADLPVTRVVEGGSSRARSVAAGLAAVGEEVDVVLVHDTARPMVSGNLIERVLDALGESDGALAATPLTDTLKRAGEDLAVTETLDRSAHWLAQTPQGFRRGVLTEALARAAAEDRLDTATDCASLLEAIGRRVRIVPSPPSNLKVTTPIDLEIAGRLLAERES